MDLKSLSETRDQGEQDMEMKAIKFVLNGEEHELCVPPWRTLLEMIREDL